MRIDGVSYTVYRMRINAHGCTAMLGKRPYEPKRSRGSIEIYRFEGSIMLSIVSKGKSKSTTILFDSRDRGFLLDASVHLIRKVFDLEKIQEKKKSPKKFPRYGK